MTEFLDIVTRTYEYQRARPAFLVGTTSVLPRAEDGAMRERHPLRNELDTQSHRHAHRETCRQAQPGHGSRLHFRDVLGACLIPGNRSE
jgi:hypothetical protein